MNQIDLARGDVILRGTVTGTGPTVLLLHAGGEDRRVWTPVAARLTERGIRSVAFDLRGHGDSSGRVTTLGAVADDVTEMIRREPAPVVVVGASLGGFAAMAALADPATARHVAGLMLLDVVPDPDPARVRPWLDARGLLQGREELADDILGRGPALLSTVAALDLPILLIRGGTRSPLSDTDVNRLRRANHRVTVTRLPTAGHLVARDAPQELGQTIADQASTWLTDDAVNRAFGLQHTLGVDHIEHPGGTLLAHLRRVHALTVEWSAPPRTQLAALCHATYGTDGFGRALMPITQRQRLRQVIGLEAEALVYLYGACDRTWTYPNLGQEPLELRDRFSGVITSVHGTGLLDFAVLTIANELDVARFATLPHTTLRQISDLIRALATYAPSEAALALADSSLA